MGPVSLQSSWPLWVWTPKSPLGLGAVQLPVTLSFAYGAGSRWTFSTLGAFVLPEAFLAAFKIGPFSAGQWL